MRVVAGLAVGEGFGLRQQIRQQSGVIVGMRMIGADHADEIGRHDLGALMQRLEKTVLGVGARPAPPDRNGMRGQRRAVESRGFAQAFHHQLLKIIRQQAQAFVVGQHRLTAGVHRIAVPDRGECMPYRHVVA